MFWWELFISASSVSGARARAFNEGGALGLCDEPLPTGD
jgi:hypothetical protein